jgi:AraC family transcriptional regulator
MGFNMKGSQSTIADSFPSFLAQEELLAKVIEFFPYPIQVYTPDGTSLLVNTAMLTEYHAISPEQVVGKYNVLKDPAVLASSQLPILKQAFQGKTVFFTGIKVPLEQIAERYGIQDLDVEAVYQDITLFPIIDEMKQLLYVVAFLINRRVYRGITEIEKAKEYIETHWLDSFSAEETAKAACLSKAHFSKLFKQHTGLTPKEYYINYKISKVKEKLLDTNLSIAQAFAACNIKYNGYSTRLPKVGKSSKSSSGNSISYMSSRAIINSTISMESASSSSKVVSNSISCGSRSNCSANNFLASSRNCCIHITSIIFVNIAISIYIVLNQKQNSCP